MLDDDRPPDFVHVTVKDGRVVEVAHEWRCKADITDFLGVGCCECCGPVDMVIEIPIWTDPSYQRAG
jgi:hypothetical protein